LFCFGRDGDLIGFAASRFLSIEKTDPVFVDTGGVAPAITPLVGDFFS